LSISCTSGSKPSSKYQDTKEDLKKFMLEIKSAQDAKNFEKAERLILSIFPSKEISKKALRADLSPGLINDLYHIPLKINEMKKKMSKKEFTTFVS